MSNKAPTHNQSDTDGPQDRRREGGPRGDRSGIFQGYTLAFHNCHFTYSGRDYNRCEARWWYTEAPPDLPFPVSATSTPSQAPSRYRGLTLSNIIHAACFTLLVVLVYYTVRVLICTLPSIATNRLRKKDTRSTRAGGMDREHPTWPNFRRFCRDFWVQPKALAEFWHSEGAKALSKFGPLLAKLVYDIQSSQEFCKCKTDGLYEPSGIYVAGWRQMRSLTCESLVNGLGNEHVRLIQWGPLRIPVEKVTMRRGSVWHVFRRGSWEVFRQRVLETANVGDESSHRQKAREGKDTAWRVTHSKLFIR
ncbi:hypothetical protein BKA70DRAFT_1235755 [Coprinopsis sp. MPI-PUGE-AT-0042]|nr:hypothetical protein BKA70DRAFT_1235755 [Coprinopsis sp. MPI-PUGE-AT-0042]